MKNHIEEILKFYVAPYFGAVIIFLSIILIVNRIIHYRAEKKRRLVKEKIYSFVIKRVTDDVIWHPLSLKIQIEDFLSRIPFRKKWCKELYIQTLIDINSTLKGTIPSERIMDIYVINNLDRYSLSLIKSRRMYKKCRGFYHFQALGFTHGQRFIKSYLNHPNKIIRSSAYVAFLYITTKPLDFLAYYTHDILKASEYKVIHLLHVKKLRIPHNVEQWLDATNPAVVSLGMKFIKFHNYLKAKDKLISKLSDGNVAIRLEVINTIKALQLYEAETALIELFKGEENEMNARAILETLSVIGTKKSIPLLENLLRSNTCYNHGREIKLLAMNCLYNIMPEHEIFSKTPSLEMTKIKQHVTSHLLPVV